MGPQFGTLPKLDSFVSYAERLAQREAYKRGKDDDNQLIAEMQAAQRKGTRRWTKHGFSKRSPLRPLHARRLGPPRFLRPDDADCGERGRRDQLIAAIAASPAAAAIVAPDDKRLTTRTMTLDPAGTRPMWPSSAPVR